MRIHTPFIFIAILSTIATTWPAQADDADNPKIREFRGQDLGSIRYPIHSPLDQGPP